MMIEDSINQFVNSIISIAGITFDLDDSFFIKKLNSKTAVLIAGYIRLGKLEEEACVAQYYSIEKLISEIEGTLELLELINHLSIAKDITPLLLASRNLWVLKLEFLRFKNTSHSNLNKIGNNIQTPIVKSKDSAPVPTSDESVIQKNVQRNIELNPNKERIFNFIKKSPNTRTKDIIQEFNALSDRTVKRNLGELLRAGLINKKSENKAVYYSAGK